VKEKRVYEDLRSYLSALDERGLLSRVTRSVDKDWEVAAVCRRNFYAVPDAERTALMFTNVEGFDVPLVAGALGGSEAIYATALETSVDQVLDKWTRGVQSPIAPVRVDRGPCQENVLLGEDVDVTMFPHPIWTVGQDAGPYITGPFIISRDPENGIGNVGTYRLQVKGPDRLGMMVSPIHGTAHHIRKNEAAGRDTEIAIVIGTEPVFGLVSVTSFPHGADEMALAGGIRGAAIPVVPCRTVDLDVPATAEIVIEGRVKAGVREAEGPFGEYSGYMGEAGQNYVVQVTAVTYRTDPIYQVFVSQMPPSESSCIRRLGRSMTVLEHLRHTLGLPVTDVNFPEASGAAPFLLIAMKKAFEGQVMQAMHGAWSVDPSLGKFTIVVDDDIDIRDPAAVEWALGWHVQPARDVQIVEGTVPLGLDPSQPAQGFGTPPQRISSKLGIDATRKGTFPAPSVPPKEHLDKVRAAWSEYGIQKAGNGAHGGQVA
jgi:UbiD family decarboxylase